MKKPLLGLIGGMGTQATACFYEILHKQQNVTTEQQFLDLIIYSMPSIPDRTAFITGQSSESPYEPLLHAVKTLETAGVSLLAMLCITSHYFYHDLCKNVTIPFLNMPDETALYAQEQGIKKIGLLATDGTIKGKMLHTAFEKLGISVLVPSEDIQTDLMKVIYDIKRGISVPPEALNPMAAQLHEQGAEAIVLGCTELCIAKKDSPEWINTLEVLANAVLKKH